MNFWECLPTEISSLVAGVKGVRELRLRNGRAVKLNVNGKWFWVGKQALVTNEASAVPFGDLCDAVVRRACNGSVFAYEKMLAQGFFTLSDGTRIGVCGVMGANGVFQKYTSLCVRTANYFRCVKDSFDGSLLVSGPPRSGKTTYLRDLACTLSQKQNVVVVDERGEISSCNGFASFSQCDVFRFADKRYAFEVAVRSMSPDWIVCDELAEGEFHLLKNAVTTGVKIAASLHADNVEQLKLRLGSNLMLFDYALFLQKDTFAQTLVSLKAQK